MEVSLIFRSNGATLYFSPYCSLMLKVVQVQNPLLEFSPILKASSMVSGSFSPKVSGKKAAKSPATVATVPMMKTGAGNQSSCHYG